MKKFFLKIVLAFGALNSWMGLAASEQDVPITYSCDCRGVDITEYELIRSYKTATSEGDDGSSNSAIRLPFDFRLFSHKIDSVYVNINGSVSDQRVRSFKTIDFNNYGLTEFMIAPYWADIHLGRKNTDSTHVCGDIYYKYLVKNGTDTVGLKILWHEVGFYWSGAGDDKGLCCDATKKTTFELTMTNGDPSILPDGKNVSFCYKKIGFAIGNASDIELGTAASSSYISDERGFHNGTPATVGFVYNGDYYQVGQYDRPGSDVGNLNLEDNTYYFDEGGTTKTYSGIGTLLSKSKNCELAFDLKNIHNVNRSECENGQYIISVFSAIRNSSEANEYSIIIDDETMFHVSAPSGYIRRDFMYPADGHSHHVTILYGNLFYSYDIQSPQCGCGEGSSLEIDGITVDQSITVCQGLPIHIKHKSRRGLVNPRYVWSFNDMVIGQGGEMSSRIESFTAPRSGRLAVNIESDDCKESVNMEVNLNVNLCNPDECNECPSLFAPQAGEKYFVSGWVKDENQVGVDSFENVYLQVAFKLMGDDNLQKINCYPEGNIIDGWQRISGSFTIPARAENMSINLKNDGSSNEVYFDDIRFHPFNASMKSYVYDPKTLRLAAELDEENYATFYEYDEEGALVRIKKETERGVMTIREARQSKPKK